MNVRYGHGLALRVDSHWLMALWDDREVDSMMPTLRIARSTDQLDTVVVMYRDGLELKQIGKFEDHDGFDGVILGRRNWPIHLEFTRQRGHAVGRAPSKDHLLVFYWPDLLEWQDRCAKMQRAGFAQVPSYNPYWDQNGVTFEDVDGYRVVLFNEAWVTP